MLNEDKAEVQENIEQILIICYGEEELQPHPNRVYNLYEKEVAKTIVDTLERNGMLHDPHPMRRFPGREV